MPMYEFECEKCRKHFTLQHTFSEYDEHKKEKCPKCVPGTVSTPRVA